MTKRRLIYNVEDSKEMMGKALVGSFLGVLSILFTAYIIYCFEDKSILTRATIFNYYAQGNSLNEILGLWAVSFTPISSLGTIAPDWIDDWFYYIAPCLVAGLAIAIKTKSVKWSLVGGLYFIVWGTVLPMVFIYILPIFGLSDPSSINASLISAYSDVYHSFPGVYQGIINLFQSIYLGWCIAGSIEIGLVSLIFSLPLALIFNVLSKLFSK
ncbi:MAG: hypothetical protein ACTSU2_10035 [Promethearchaeota archaeon]